MGFTATEGSCFRPLTGTLLSKQEYLAEQEKEYLIVSVPSRGLSYLNTCMHYNPPIFPIKFPSPHGDSLI